MIIYKAINLINDKCYVGKTTTFLEKRINEHINSKDNLYFHNAIKKYGYENFKWEILYDCDDELLLNLMETFKIIINHSHMNENGYNMTWGGDGISGYSHTDETKKKISNSLKGVKNPMYGKHLSDEVKEKHRLSVLGFKHTEKAKKKIKLAKIGSVPWNKGKSTGKGEKNPFYGKKHTEETKKKMKLVKTGRSLSMETRKKMSESQKKRYALLGSKKKEIKEGTGIRGWFDDII